MSGAHPSHDVLVEAAAETDDARPVLPRITVPVLLVAGDRDLCFARETIEETARLLPDCSLVWYEGLGHLRTIGSSRVPGDVLGFTGTPRPPRLPPRWFVRLFWSGHRGVYRVTGGRLGTWRPKPGRWGTLRLTTTGRRSGQPRSVIVGYVEDGPNLVTMAMNGWAEAEPAWWLNLQADPIATVELGDASRTVRGRAAQGEERARLWARWRDLDANLDALAARRPTETAVVVLEPVTAPDRAAQAPGTDSGSNP